MTSKYKPTDLVRIKKLEEVRKSKMYVSRMDKYAGTVQRIDKQFIYADGFYTLEGIPGTYFTDSMIAGLAEEKKTVRVRVDKASSNHRHYDHLVGKEIEVEEFGNDSNNRYWLEKVGAIYKSDCTIITKEPDKVVPPGIISLRRVSDGHISRHDEVAHTGAWPYKKWVEFMLRDHPNLAKFEVHTIRDSNGVEWSVGEDAKWKHGIFKIEGFDYDFVKQKWLAKYLTTEFIGVSALSKLPLPEEHTEPDKERLEKYVLAIADTAYYSGLSTDDVIRNAIELMTAVDNYKPTQESRSK